MERNKRFYLKFSVSSGLYTGRQIKLLTLLQPILKPFLVKVDTPVREDDCLALESNFHCDFASILLAQDCSDDRSLLVS